MEESDDESSEYIEMEEDEEAVSKYYLGIAKHYM